MRHAALSVSLVVLGLATGLTRVQFANVKAGQAAWKSSGPGGPIQAIAVDPQRPATLYAGPGDTPAGSGVYKSVDGGSSWQIMNTGLTSPDVVGLAINSRRPDIIYVALNAESSDVKGGIFKSVDRAGHWHATNTGLNPYAGGYGMIVSDPQQSRVLYAIAALGLIKSTDGGENWKATSIGSGRATDQRVLNVAIDPKTTTTLYVGTMHGLFKSIDGGGSWRHLDGSPDFAAGWMGQVVVVPDTTTLYVAAGLDRGGSYSFSLFKSMDGGESWRAIYSGPALAATYVVDSKSTTTLYAGNNGGVFVSTDAGMSWNPINTGLTDLVVRALAIDPKTPTTLYAGTSAGLFVLRQ